MKKTIIDMHGIVKSFYIGTPNELEILHGINITVKEGEFVSIVGQSGSGKSTLMNIIGALDRATKGSYMLDGVPIGICDDKRLSEIRNKKIGFVFQTFNLISRTSALKNVELPMLYSGVSKAERTKRAKELLDLVEMSDRMTHMPNELSGGQKQRVAIAGIIAMEPRCIILDEPTAMLDPEGRRDVMKAIKRLNRELGITVVFITHYMEEAVEADRIVVMDDSRLLMDGTPKQVFANPQKIRSIGLDVPQTCQLAELLKNDGINLKNDLLSIDELVENIDDILKGQ